MFSHGSMRLLAWDPRTFRGLSAPAAKDCLVGKGLNHMESHRDLWLAMSYQPTHPEPRRG